MRFLLHKYQQQRANCTLRRDAGFTIVELLVATAVFSVVLLIIAVGVLQFNNAFYAGITRSSTQDTARAVLENVSQAIQFGATGDSIHPTPASTPGQSYYFCTGSTRYRYILGYQLSGASSGNNTYHAMVVDNAACTGSATSPTVNIPTLSPSGTELLKPHMRLSYFAVTLVPNLPASDKLYKIEVRVVYGDDDLLVSPSNSGPTASDVVCRTGAGAQFCAVSDLSTIVQKRLD